MFKYCLLALLVIFGVACEPPAKDCQRFRTGTYTMSADGINYRFVRTDTEQLEIDLTNNVTHRLKVTWLNDCSYTLELVEPSKEEPSRNQVLTVTITKTGENFYYFESNLGGGPKMSGRLEKVR